MNRLTLMLIALLFMRAASRGEEVLAAAEAAEMVGFLSLKDQAWRNSIPKRLFIRESHRDLPHVRSSREVWVWDGRIQYSGRVERPGPQGKFALAARDFASFDAGRWFYVVTGEGDRGWKGSISETNPDKGWEWSMWRLWPSPSQHHTVQHMLEIGVIVRVARVGPDSVLVDLARNAVVARAIETRDKYLDGFLGWRIRFDGRYGWRPVVLEMVERARPIEGGDSHIPKLKFGAIGAQVSMRTNWAKFKLVSGCPLPLKVVRRVFYIRDELRQNVIEIGAEVEQIETLPPEVTFSSRPPDDFGPTGILRDQQRGETLIVDTRPEGVSHEFREQVVDQLSEYKKDAAGTDIDQSDQPPYVIIGLIVGAAALLMLFLARKRS